MLTSEFTNELGSLIRSLEQKARVETELRLINYADVEDALDNIERAIVTLVALHIAMRGKQ